MIVETKGGMSIKVGGRSKRSVGDLTLMLHHRKFHSLWCQLLPYFYIDHVLAGGPSLIGNCLDSYPTICKIIIFFAHWPTYWPSSFVLLNLHSHELDQCCFNFIQLNNKLFWGRDTDQYAYTIGDLCIPNTAAPTWPWYSLPSVEKNTSVGGLSEPGPGRNLGRQHYVIDLFSFRSISLQCTKSASSSMTHWSAVSKA